MTSSSQSDNRGSRNLAVFLTPSIPAGWHGRDLVRIVDPMGLAVAWLSPALAGAVVRFDARSSVGDDWVSLLCATHGDTSAASFVVKQNGARQPLWMATPGWTLSRRDPTSATVVSSDGAIEVHGTCESGQLRWTATGKSWSTHHVDFEFGENLGKQSVLESNSIRTNDSIEVCLFLTERIAKSNQQ